MHFGAGRILPQCCAGDLLGRVRLYVFRLRNGEPMVDILFAFIADKPVEVLGCEFISDRYDEFRHAAEQGKLL